MPSTVAVVVSDTNTVENTRAKAPTVISEHACDEYTAPQESGSIEKQADEVLAENAGESTAQGAVVPVEQAVPADLATSIVNSSTIRAQ
jgi:coenzyme F420-reducing hydrogenase gamma subunit